MDIKSKIDVFKAKAKNSHRSKVIVFNVLTIVGSFVAIFIAGEQYLAKLIDDRTMAMVMLGLSFVNGAVNIALRFMTNGPLELKCPAADGGAAASPTDTAAQ